MIALLYSKLSDPQFMAMILVGIAATATVFTVAMPLVEGDSLGRRMKAVALERDKIRARERERLSKTQQTVSLRQASKAYMKQTVERRQAYENLGNRTGLEAVKSITTALIQAERYGTPLGQALRVLSQESRDIRMNEAEKKAAALPPKLTVPMILFFLPVLFVVIMTPALIQVFGWK